MLSIKHPLTGEKLQVANQDLKDEMDWLDAQEACENIGPGWRLPTIDECKAIYHQLHKKGIGDLNTGLYWSSTKHSYSDWKYFSFSFYTGTSHSNSHDYREWSFELQNVRAVKPI